jgi:hypothetical protein
MLAETAAVAAWKTSKGAGFLPPPPEWLPFLNSYRTLCMVPTPEMRAILQDFRYYEARIPR